jgi:hypothetical protein
MNLKKIIKNGPFHYLKLLHFHTKLISYFKFKYFLASFKNKPKTILFYPDKPYDQFSIYKVCHLLGYKMTKNPNSNFDLAFHWKDATYKTQDNIIKSINKKTKVINFKCNDISKDALAKAFKKAFKYSLEINPTKYKGYCVQKSNNNARKDGKLIKCPTKKLPGYSYEKYADSTNKEGFLVDIRTPIFKDQIPFVYLRFKPQNEKFIDSKNQKVTFAETKDIFSEKEVKQIVSFCKNLGFDYGEMDILRDCKNKKIYIVDANTTPFGPHRLPKDVTKKALKRLPETFKKTYFKN